MYIRLKPWQFFALMAVTIALLAYSLQRFRYRLVRDNLDLVRLLPQRQASTFFVNVSALRAGAVLTLLSSPKTQEADYQQFVSETGFDYTRDLDAIAGNTDTRDAFFAVKGRFDWSRLVGYVRAHGGTCHEYCSMQTTPREKWVSFRMLQPDVIALAVSTSSGAVTRMRGLASSTPLPEQPLWIRLGPAALDGSASWSPPARILASTLHSSRQITFSVGSATSGGLALRMDARFDSEHIAEAVRNQLELETRMLKLEITREHEKPSVADLTGLLVAGSFQLVNSDVVATWPLHRELLQNLQIQ